MADWLPDWLEEGIDDAGIDFIQKRGMTKFERTVLIGHRASQLGQGSAARASAHGSTRPLDIAAAETDANTLPPMRVFRHLPDGSVVSHEVSQLDQARRRTRLW